MSHPSFCSFTIFCIPSLLFLLFSPPTHPILSSYSLSHIPFHLHVLFHWPSYPTPLYSAPTSSTYHFSASHVPLPSMVHLSSSALPFSTIFPSSSAPVAHGSPPLPAITHHVSFPLTASPSPTTSYSFFLPSSFISLFSHHLPRPLPISLPPHHPPHPVLSCVLPSPTFHSSFL